MYLGVFWRLDSGHACCFTDIAWDILNRYYPYTNIILPYKHAFSMISLFSHANFTDSSIVMADISTEHDIQEIIIIGRLSSGR